jgi:hypothetical protein
MLKWHAQITVFNASNYPVIDVLRLDTYTNLIMLLLFCWILDVWDTRWNIIIVYNTMNDSLLG